MNADEKNLLCYMAMVVARIHSNMISEISFDKKEKEKEKEILCTFVERIEKVNPECGKIAKHWAVEKSNEYKKANLSKKIKDILNQDPQWKHKDNIKED